MVEEKINNAQFNVGIYIRLSQEDDDKKLYLGKLSGMDEVLSCLGYKTKMKYGLVKKEEE